MGEEEQREELALSHREWGWMVDVEINQARNHCGAGEGPVRVGWSRIDALDAVASDHHAATSQPAHTGLDHGHGGELEARLRNDQPRRAQRDPEEQRDDGAAHSSDGEEARGESRHALRLAHPLSPRTRRFVVAGIGQGINRFARVLAHHERDGTRSRFPEIALPLHVVVFE